MDAAYDIPNLSKYLDYIHVMTYDFHGSYDGVTGQNAPLYASSVDTTAAQKLLNVVSDNLNHVCQTHLYLTCPIASSSKQV